MARCSGSGQSRRASANVRKNNLIFMEASGHGGALCVAGPFIPTEELVLRLSQDTTVAVAEF
jgi:uncharacterized protein (DUF433 family)